MQIHSSLISGQITWIDQYRSLGRMDVILRLEDLPPDKLDETQEWKSDYWEALELLKKGVF